MVFKKKQKNIQIGFCLNGHAFMAQGSPKPYHHYIILDINNEHIVSMYRSHNLCSFPRSWNSG